MFTALFLFAVAFSGRATTIVVLLNTPNGDMGTSHVFTQDGVTITAYSYAISGNSQPDLYGKNGGADGTGLGLTNDPDHEINTTDFVQLDFANPIALKVTQAQFQMDSVQCGEGWALYGSNTQGTLGTELMTSNSQDAESVLALPHFGEYDDYSWTATSGNVLLGEILLTPGAAATDAGAPDPQSMAATGAALIGLSLMVRRLRQPR